MKKLVSLVLVAALSLGALVGCGNKEPEYKIDGDFQYIAAADVKDLKDCHILDVREWDKYVQGRVANSEWCPIFPLEDEALEKAMVEYADKNLKDDKKIYIVCNSGARGAEKATKVLAEQAGINPELIYTVEGGAKALSEAGLLTTNRYDEAIEWQYVSGEDALKAAKSGKAQIFDVRDADSFAAGHIDGSINAGAKEVEDPAVQQAVYDAAQSLDKSKPVYFLCYSGNKCAKTAISILKDSGFPLENLFIITDGAKDSTIANAFVK